MRRKDRSMSREYGLGIIDKARYGIASMIDGEEPYGIPLSIVRDGENLYFHSAKGGRKVETLKANPNLSIAFVGEVKIPENFTKDELDEMARDSSKAVTFISSVFTTEFESTLVRGKAELIEDRDEKIKAMRMICEKYTPSKMEYFEVAINAGLGRTNVYRVPIDEISAKRKKYDGDGKEMKWERME